MYTPETAPMLMQLVTESMTKYSRRLQLPSSPAVGLIWIFTVASSSRRSPAQLTHHHCLHHRLPHSHHTAGSLGRDGGIVRDGPRLRCVGALQNTRDQSLLQVNLHTLSTHNSDSTGTVHGACFMYPMNIIEFNMPHLAAFVSNTATTRT